MVDEASDAERSITEGEVQAAPAGMNLIYVDDSAPATLCFSEKSVPYPTLRDAIVAWQALPHDVKRITSIQSDQNGAVYRGWEIYRIWGR